MAYHGFLRLLKDRFASYPKGYVPSLLEVGVDRGVTYLTLVNFLARTRDSFLAVGVDVLIQEQVRIMLSNADLSGQQAAFLVEGNSLLALPRMIQQNMKFDVVLLDGDHNYHTVSQEMGMLPHLVKDGGVVVIDDYDGKWSERDLWYAEREGYEGNKNVSQRVDTEKHGVKPAVDEWLAAHPEWVKSKPIMGEPIMLELVR